MKALGTKDRTLPYFVGVLSKKEVPKLLSEGVLHIHSTSQGKNDPFVIETHQFLSSNKMGPYSWEPKKQTEDCIIHSSKMRRQLISNISKNCPVLHKSGLREKIETVSEELITNAIFHAYQEKEGHSKYNRKSEVELLPNESIAFSFYTDSSHGVYISVRDFAGTLSLENIGRAFIRCYSKEKGLQIETKESGAGLGLFMVFELVKHLKIEVLRGQSTTISCLIPIHRNDSSVFTFNYFERVIK